MSSSCVSPRRSSYTPIRDGILSRLSLLKYADCWGLRNRAPRPTTPNRMAWWRDTIEPCWICWRLQWWTGHSSGSNICVDCASRTTPASTPPRGSLPSRLCLVDKLVSPWMLLLAPPLPLLLPFRSMWLGCTRVWSSRMVVLETRWATSSKNRRPDMTHRHRDDPSKWVTRCGCTTPQCQGGGPGNYTDHGQGRTGWLSNSRRQFTVFNIPSVPDADQWYTLTTSNCAQRVLGCHQDKGEGAECQCRAEMQPRHPSPSEVKWSC